MNRNEAISGLVNYALEKEMIQPEEKAWAVNGLLDILQLDAFFPGRKAKRPERQSYWIHCLMMLMNVAFLRKIQLFTEIFWIQN